jgi:hypothetical protein
MIDMQDSFIGELITVGRKSRKEHRISLRLVYYKGRYYASRRNANSDWLKNLITEPKVKIIVNGEIIRCLAKVIDDQAFSNKISRIKYDDERASMNRIVVELMPV